MKISQCRVAKKVLKIRNWISWESRWKYFLIILIPSNKPMKTLIICFYQYRHHKIKQFCKISFQMVMKIFWILNRRYSKLKKYLVKMHINIIPVCLWVMFEVQVYLWILLARYSDHLKVQMFVCKSLIIISFSVVTLNYD